MSDHPLDTAATALDRVLAARPHLDGAAFTEATKAICVWREDLRLVVRGGGDATAGAKLKAANLAITVLLAGHFPLDKTPWNELEALRSRIAALRQGEPA